MKNTNNISNSELSETVESRELFLYATNNRETYNLVIPVINNLKKHYKKGYYNAEKAIKSYYRIAHYASNLYFRDFGYKFSVTDKKLCALRMENFYFDQVSED